MADNVTALNGVVPCIMIPRRQVGKAIADYRIVEEDTYSVVTQVVPAGKTLCGLCSRLRRGILYRVADKLGATRIALGHHREDVVETLFLNMFYGAALKAMLAAWETEDPGRTERLFRSLRNVTLSHLADPDRYDFRSLTSIRN